jgi:hypothetical protein
MVDASFDVSRKQSGRVIYTTLLFSTVVVVRRTLEELLNDAVTSLARSS